jgi:hypothetical protein
MGIGAIGESLLITGGHDFMRIVARDYQFLYDATVQRDRDISEFRFGSIADLTPAIRYVR